MTPQEFLSVFWEPGFHNALAHDFNGHFSNKWDTPVEETVGGVNWYFAPFAFNEKRRKQEFAVHTKALWLDVDVKDGHNETQKSALRAIRDMVERFNLPSPMLVSSGAGVHVYFVCKDLITKLEWEPLAAALRAMCEESGLHVDHKRTQDAASVMRLPGTINQKPERDALEVKVLKANYEALPLAKFKAKFKDFIPKVPVAPKGISYREEADILSYFGNSHKAERYDPDRIADQCLQVAKVRSSRGNVPEPLWYHTLQLLRFVKNGHEVSHDWSSGYPAYSFEETEAKIAQLEGVEAGPTTCKRFEAEGEPGACSQCVHRGQITTPLSLGVAGYDENTGRLSTSVQDRFEGYDPIIPAPYYIDEDGAVLMRGKSGEGTLIHPQTIFIDDRYKETDAQWHFKIIVDTPRDGIRELKLSAEAFSNPNMFYTELAVRGILTKDMPKEERHLYNYIYKCAEAIWSEKEVVEYFEHYGWDNAGQEFNLGMSHYSPAGEASAECAEDASATVKMEGHELAPWREVVQHYASAPLAYRVAFFASLASPLLHMTGLDGVMFSLFSPLSGIGKTTALEAACAVWGNPKELLKRQNDTPNSLLNYAGFMHNLPVCVDEFSCAKVEDFQNFIYEVSGGRERGRLTKEIQQRKGGKWSTIFTASTNSSLVGQIPLGDNFEGTAARIIEAQVFEYTSGDNLGKIHHIIDQHWGALGHAWAQHIVKHRERIEKVVRQLHKKVQHDNEGAYRYYSALISSVAVAMHEVGQMLDVAMGDVRPTIRAFMELFQPGKVLPDMPGMTSVGVDGYTSLPSLEQATYVRKATQSVKDMRHRAVESIVNTAMEKGGYSLVLTEKKAEAQHALGVQQRTYTVLEGPDYLVLSGTLCGKLLTVMKDQMEPVRILPGGAYTTKDTMGIRAYKLHKPWVTELNVVGGTATKETKETIDKQENEDEQHHEAG